jgi:hypothetical protein
MCTRAIPDDEWAAINVGARLNPCIFYKTNPAGFFVVNPLKFHFYQLHAITAVFNMICTYYL